MDPWMIHPRERARYQQQFESLRPINGIITGVQAKGLLLRSELPPVVLGQIWYKISLTHIKYLLYKEITHFITNLL